jgi:replicative DNA helicase
MEAERAVLGAILIGGDRAGIEARGILGSDAEGVFYVRAHQVIYGAMVRLMDRGQPMGDVALLLAELGEQGQNEAGGSAYIGELTEAVPTSANVDYYAAIVRDCAVRRRLIDVGGRIARMAGDVDGRSSTEVLGDAEAALLDVVNTGGALSKPAGMNTLAGDAEDWFEALSKSPGGITGLRTGLASLDRLTGGLLPWLVVVGGKSGFGKTAFSLSMALHVAFREGKHAAFVSLEMTKAQLATRAVCSLGGVSLNRFKQGGSLQRDEFKRVSRAIAELKMAPSNLFIDDQVGMGVAEIRSRLLRHVLEHGALHLIVIDYAQLVRGSGREESAAVRFEEIAHGLNELKKEFDCPVIVLTQLNKDDGTRWSAAFEHDADVIVKLRGSEHPEDGENVVIAAVEKFRHGPTADLRLVFQRDVQRFRDFGDEAEPGGWSPEPREPDQDEFELSVQTASGGEDMEYYEEDDGVF